jgi:hypothetical protein
MACPRLECVRHPLNVKRYHIRRTAESLSGMLRTARIRGIVKRAVVLALLLRERLPNRIRCLDERNEHTAPE